MVLGDDLRILREYFTDATILNSDVIVTQQFEIINERQDRRSATAPNLDGLFQKARRLLINPKDESVVEEIATLVKEAEEAVDDFVESLAA